MAQNITAAGATCNGTGACVQQAVATTNGGASVSLSGTFSATLQFEATNAANPYDPLNAGLWTSIQMTPTSSGTAATSATAPGIWQANVAGLTAIRVRCSAYTSGTVAVVINLSSASARTNGGSGVGAGVSSFTCDGVLLSCSGSTGAVAQSQVAAPADTVYGNPTGGSAAPTNTANPIVGTIQANGTLGASQSSFFSSAADLTGGSGTTTFPQIFLNEGTAVSSWSTNGTAIGLNMPNAWVGNYMDFRRNGVATPDFVLSQGGSMDIASTFKAAGYFFHSSGHLLFSSTAPIAGTCGTTPSIPANNGTVGFTVNVGSGGTASTCTVTMPAAATGWGCMVSPNGAPQAAAVTYSAPTSTTLITLTNYTQSTGVALAWTSGLIFNVNCVAY